MASKMILKTIYYLAWTKYLNNFHFLRTISIFKFAQITREKTAVLLDNPLLVFLLSK